jgi:hypothetical protein
LAWFTCHLFPLLPVARRLGRFVSAHIAKHEATCG